MSTPSTHALLSPSAASRWLNCTPAPRLEAELPETTSEYAAEGTLEHSVCELFARKKFTIVKPSAHNAALKKLKKHELWNDEMLTTAATYVDHLLERYMSFPNKPYIVFEVKVDITDYVPEAYGTCDCVKIGGDERPHLDGVRAVPFPVGAGEGIGAAAEFITFVEFRGKLGCKVDSSHNNFLSYNYVPSYQIDSNSASAVLFPLVDNDPVERALFFSSCALRAASIFCCSN